MSHVRIVLALALVAPALAGCLVQEPLETASVAGATQDAAAIAARLSQHLGDVPLLYEVVDVETRHGLIHVDVYRPDVEGPVPVVLVASPYNNPNSPLNYPDGGKGGKDNWIDLRLYNWMREELLPRGYAFAQMDILGTRNSGGCQGIMNAAERQSTADVVDWLGVQPWSTGKVGMVGKSYLGMSQIGAAVENPAHLAAIVPISPPTHDYAYHYYQGVPYALNHITNFLYTGAYSLPPPDAEGADLANYAARYPERVPCAPESFAGGVYTMGDYSQRWQERDYRPLIAGMRDDIAVWFIAGHQDWNVKPDHVTAIYDQIPGPKSLLVGQWAHDYPNINRWDDKTFGDREDWYFQLHRWFDHHLKGIDTGLMTEMAACPVETQATDGTWRCLQSFPPTVEAGDDVANVTLYFHDDGSLAADPGTGTRAFSDAVGHGLEGFAVFKTEPFAETTRVVGTPMMTMRASTTSAWNAHLTVALALEKNGRYEEFDWGFQSLRHRGGLEAGQPVVPNAAYDVTFPLYPLDHVFEAGEQLVVILRGTSDGPNGGILANPEPGIITVTLPGTWLTLPTATLDREFTPLLAAQLPEAYPAETDA